MSELEQPVVVVVDRNTGKKYVAKKEYAKRLDRQGKVKVVGDNLSSVVVKK